MKNTELKKGDKVCDNCNNLNCSENPKGNLC